VDFLALPEEQAELLTAADQERPMQAIVQLFGIEPEAYLPVALEPSAVMDVLQHPAIERDPTVHIYLRDASLGGSFVWRPHPNPRVQRGLDFTRSLCVEVSASVRVRDRLVAGGIGDAGKGSYEDVGLDPAIARRLKMFLERKLRKLCPHRAASPWTVSALERGEKTLRSVSNMLAHVSAGAVRFREEGGHWIDPHRGRLDWEYQPIDPTK